MAEDLVERVGLAIEYAKGPATSIICEAEARAAITAVLEELKDNPTDKALSLAWGYCDFASTAGSGHEREQIIREVKMMLGVIIEQFAATHNTPLKGGI